MSTAGLTTSQSLKRRRTRVLAVLLVLAFVAAGGAALLWSLAADGSVDTVSFSFNHSDRTHLKPIPVSQVACPSVVRMHGAANDLDAAYPPLGPYTVSDGRLVAVPWPSAREALLRAADSLEQAIDAGITTLPAEVRRYLAVTRTEIRAGRAQVLLARDWEDFDARTATIMDHGRRAFASASDLVGRQCGVRLAADPR